MRGAPIDRHYSCPFRRPRQHSERHRQPPNHAGGRRVEDHAVGGAICADGRVLVAAYKGKAWASTAIVLPFAIGPLRGGGVAVLNASLWPGFRRRHGPVSRSPCITMVGRTTTSASSRSGTAGVRVAGVLCVAEPDFVAPHPNGLSIPVTLPSVLAKPSPPKPSSLTAVPSGLRDPDGGSTATPRPAEELYALGALGTTTHRQLNTPPSAGYQISSTLVDRDFFLDSFKASDLSAAYLAAVQNDFDVAREAGVKLIPRSPTPTK